MDEELLIGTLTAEITGLLSAGKNRILIGIDGRCGAGKSTLAASIASLIDCNLFHADDFFLPPEMRTPERLAQPGGNMHRERLKEEVVDGIKSGKPFTYHAFSCTDGNLTAVTVTPKRINIIEGTYSAHPEMKIPYDILVFCDVSPEEQMKRIKRRNGEKMAEIFRTKWIPLEEAYFSHFGIKEKSDYVMDMQFKEGNSVK